MSARRRMPSRRALRLPAALVLLLLAAAPRAEERIRVRLASPAGEVEDLRLEDYVAGVVAGEMPGSFPAEAQKAQAAGRDWDIGAGILAQVYHRQERPSARAAADATVGEVLVQGVEPVEAYFHAVCVGRTETGLAALGRDLPYLASVECGPCDQAPGARWRVRMPAGELGRVAGLGGAVDAVRVVARTGSGRAERVELARRGRSVGLAAADLRRRLGFSRLPSLAFEVSAAAGAFVFEGTGQGHGAGMCQWGAAGLAREGKTYREILAHYYPGTEVVKMY